MLPIIPVSIGVTIKAKTGAIYENSAGKREEKRLLKAPKM
jgi:hypothetical protein